MTTLFQAADQAVKAIRAGRSVDEIRPLVKQVSTAYEKVCDAIRGHGR